MLFLNVLSAFIDLKKLNLPNVPIAYIDIFCGKTQIDMSRNAKDMRPWPNQKLANYLRMPTA